VEKPDLTGSGTRIEEQFAISVRSLISSLHEQLQ